MGMGDKERRREGVMVPEPWTQGAEWAMKAYSAMVSGDADNLLYPPEHYKIKRGGGWTKE